MCFSVVTNDSNEDADGEMWWLEGMTDINWEKQYNNVLRVSGERSMRWHIDITLHIEWRTPIIYPNDTNLL